MENADKAFTALKNAMDGYTKISDKTWQSLKVISRFRTLDKKDILYQIGEIPNTFSFVYSGLFRNFVIDKHGNEYNKIFFDEGSFPGSMVALLKAEPSKFTIEALEPSSIIEINFTEYRKLLIKYHDLKLFQIYYLEKNWLIVKEDREIAIVQNDAAYRYKKFLKEYPSLENRLPQYHIASHIGVTPTQLSRIRKK
jgi:CRP-like cAMP-binding protein